MDDELYVAFGAKVTTTSNNNPTIAPPIAWLTISQRQNCPMAAGQSGQCPLWVKSGHVHCTRRCLLVPIGDIALTRTRAARLCQSLWTIRSSEQFCTDFSFEVGETEWFETPKPSAQVFCFNLKNIC
jgi:hypothetical protein